MADDLFAGFETAQNADFFVGFEAAQAAIATAFREESAQLDAQWRAIEGKAQGTIGIAGIFTGFVLGGAKDYAAIVPRWGAWLGIVALALLVLAIVACALALHVKTSKAPPTADYLERLATDFARLSSYDQRIARAPIQQDFLRPWRESVRDAKVKVASKANWVIIAQYSLLGAILVAAALAVLVIVVTRASPTPFQPS
jgi:hypothetical protein